MTDSGTITGSIAGTLVPEVFAEYWKQNIVGQVSVAVQQQASEAIMAQSASAIIQESNPWELLRKLQQDFETVTRERDGYRRRWEETETNFTLVPREKKGDESTYSDIEQE